MKDHAIGVLDSGNGGITVTKEIISILPQESIIYIGDAINIPYGKKTSKEIYYLTRKMIAFLLEKKVKLIVIACNTITVSAINKLRRDFPSVPIVGTVPIVKKAAYISKNKRIGILSTTRTANSAYQKKLIKTYTESFNVLNLGTDRLVPLIENGLIETNKMNSVLIQILQRFQENKIDTLVLGCTHYPFLRKKIESIIGANVEILDSGAPIGRQVKKILENNKLLADSNKPEYFFYTTGLQSRMAHLIHMYIPDQNYQAKSITL
jgi:glutamate racemase